jgi:hypothetical protein
MTWIKIITQFLIAFVLLALAVAIGPLLMIWSINTLFPIVHIPYTWETWAAAFFLSAPFSAGAFKRKKD